MDIKTTVQQIRTMIGDAEMEAALDKTRGLLQAHAMNKALVHLDLIESEWNEIKDRQINGILSLDDQMRLQNISRGKLMQLLLEISGDDQLDAHLISPETAPENQERQSGNRAFREGFKNALGVCLFIPAAGALIGSEWIVAACFGLAGLITFVPTLRFIEKTLRYELLSWQKYVLVIGALLLAGQVHTSKADPANRDRLLENAH